MALGDALSSFMGAARRANSSLVPRVVVVGPRVRQRIMHWWTEKPAYHPLQSKAVWTTAHGSHNGAVFLGET
ncbi:hypothetical protein EV561_10769 [Rhizobium sp. BK376]|nr:hypothetical protein EV561_10769 [Rhizobium sp. BK376]